MKEHPKRTISSEEASLFSHFSYTRYQLGDRGTYYHEIESLPLKYYFQTNFYLGKN